MKIVLTAALLVLSASALADEYVNGYSKEDGTYVAPHMRSSPNNQQWDNYSTKGNINPYTAQPGTRPDTSGERYVPNPYKPNNRRSNY